MNYCDHFENHNYDDYYYKVHNVDSLDSLDALDALDELDLLNVAKYYFRSLQ